MKAATRFSCIILLALFALEIAESQFSYSRNLFGLAMRNNPIEPMCLPDDSPCERLTDCCSNWCHPYLPVPRCEPSPCGCPQPPWTPEPIAERCIPYGRYCDWKNHYECCTGYCQPRYPSARCGESPCKECE